MALVMSDRLEVIKPKDFRIYSRDRIPYKKAPTMLEEDLKTVLGKRLTAFISISEECRMDVMEMLRGRDIRTKAYFGYLAGAGFGVVLFPPNSSLRYVSSPWDPGKPLSTKWREWGE